MQKIANIDRLKNRKRKNVKYKKYTGYYLYPQADNNIFETDTGYINFYEMDKEKYSIRKFVKKECSKEQGNKFRSNIKNIISVIRKNVRQNLINNGLDKTYRIHKIVPDFEWYHSTKPVVGSAINFSVFIENKILSTDTIKYYILCSFLYDETEFKDKLNIDSADKTNILYENIYKEQLNSLDKGLLFAASEVLIDLKTNKISEDPLTINDYLDLLGIKSNTKQIIETIQTTTVKESKVNLNLAAPVSTKYLLEIYSPFSHSVVQSEDGDTENTKTGFLIEKKNLVLDPIVLANYDVDIYSFFVNKKDKSVIDTHHVNFSLDEMSLNGKEKVIYKNSVIEEDGERLKFLFFNLEKKDFVDMLCNTYILASSFMKEAKNASAEDLYHNYVLYHCFH